MHFASSARVLKTGETGLLRSHLWGPSKVMDRIEGQASVISVTHQGK